MAGIPSIYRQNANPDGVPSIYRNEVVPSQSDGLIDSVRVIDNVTDMDTLTEPL